MKKFLLPLAFVAVMGMQAQTTIVDEKFEKDNQPLGYNFLPKNNKLVIQKGNVPKMVVYKKIQSLNEYTSNSEKQILLDNAEVMRCNFSETENGFNVQSISSMESGSKVKFYLDGKSSESYDSSKANKFKFSDNFGFYLSNKNGSIADKLDDKNISLIRIDTRTLKETNISIELPNLNRLQGENLVKHVVGKLSVSLKTYGIAYQLNILDNEHFEIVTKGIDKDFKSMTLYRTIYNNEGKMVEDIKYEIDLKGMYLILSNTGGGSFSVDNTGLYSFLDYLSINNYIVDQETKDIFVYGLFGKEGISNQSGYYIFKFSEKGEKLFESINYIKDKEFEAKSFKANIFNEPIIIGNKLLYTVGHTKKIYTISTLHYFNLNYSILDIETGKQLSSKSIECSLSRSDGNRNFIDALNTSKELKNKAVDKNAYALYDYNPAIKKYINSVTNKEKVSFKCEISKEGIWLIESDNEEYYKVTYFEHK
jgi:hypothetical protein